MSDCCDSNPLPDEASNPPALQGPGAPILVTDPHKRACPTDREETDAVVAMRRALREYLQAQYVDVDGARVRLHTVFEEWADPEDDAVVYPSAAVLAPASITYDAHAFTPQVGPPLPSGRYLAKQSEATAEFTIEVHSDSSGQRDAMARLLERWANPVDWMSGFRLDCPWYFGQRAEFELLSATWPDDAASARHGLRIIQLVVAGRISVVRPREYPIAQIGADVRVTEGAPARVVKIRPPQSP